MKLLQRLKNLFLPEGQISDGFHTFDELYHYRMLYNAAFFNSLEAETNIINHGELLTQSLRDVKANFLAIMETLPECFVGKCPFDIVLEVMEQLGFEELEHETNGWELDYWATFVKGNLTYSISGSHYYGNCVVEKEL